MSQDLMQYIEKILVENMELCGSRVLAQSLVNHSAHADTMQYCNAHRMLTEFRNYMPSEMPMPCVEDGEDDYGAS